MATITLVAGSAKVWAFVTIAASVSTLEDSLNVASITDVGIGVYTVNFSVTMDNVNYAGLFTAAHNAAFVASQENSRTATTLGIIIWDPIAQDFIDPQAFSVSVYGDGPA